MFCYGLFVKLPIYNKKFNIVPEHSVPFIHTVHSYLLAILEYVIFLHNITNIAITAWFFKCQPFIFYHIFSKLHDTRYSQFILYLVYIASSNCLPHCPYIFPRSMPPNTTPLPPDNQVQELIRVHQHGHPILPRILQLHQFLYSGYFTDRAALYYLFYNPSILLPGNFYCQLPLDLSQHCPEP